MRSLEKLTMIIGHATYHGIDDHVLEIRRLNAMPSVRIVPGHVATFAAWALSFDQAAIYVGIVNDGLLVIGQLMSGLETAVSIKVDPESLAAAGLSGRVTPEQLRAFAGEPVMA